MKRKIISTFFVCLMAITAIGLTSCGNKLDIKKINELTGIENPSSAQIDEMINQMEIVADIPAEELNKMNEDDQMSIGNLIFELGLSTYSEGMPDSQIKVSKEQREKIKKALDKINKSNQDFMKSCMQAETAEE